MRNPLRTEAEAFSFVLVVAVLFLAVALAGTLGGGWVGLAMFLGLVIGVAAGMYLKSDPREREPAVWERQAPPPP
ncbi:MAG: hypothetical protein M3265_01400 [Actinomycetota bacterium]|nr:hypothetical protein [Actinomycetota bacterium]